MGELQLAVPAKHRLLSLVAEPWLGADGYAMKASPRQVRSNALAPLWKHVQDPCSVAGRCVLRRDTGNSFSPRSPKTSQSTYRGDDWKSGETGSRRLS